MTAPSLSLPVKVLRSATAGRRPGDGTFRALTDGEIFVNTQDKVLCFLNAAGALVTFPLDPAVLAALAPLASPALTGSPTAPTPASGDSSTSLATTAFVAAAVAALGNSSPAVLDTLKELADALGDDPNYAATTATALALRLRVDAAQGLTAAQQLQARSNLGIDGRKSVADAAYTILPTDRMVAVTSLTAARILTLPAASAFPQGARLLIVDEALKAGTFAVSIAPAGTDKINGAASAIVLGVNGGYVALESSGTGWTITDAAVPTAAEIAAGLGYVPGRPTGSLTASGSASDFGANGTYFVATQVTFVATASNFLVFGSALFGHGVDVATNFFAYVDVLDVAAGALAYQSQALAVQLKSSTNPYGSLTPAGGSSGLGIGRTYTARIWIQRGQANGPTTYGATVNVASF